jgi:hypothetical protein
MIYIKNLTINDLAQIIFGKTTITLQKNSKYYVKKHKKQDNRLCFALPLHSENKIIR